MSTFDPEKLRPHIAVVASAFGGSEVPGKLDLLGATTSFIHGDQLTSKLRSGLLGRLTADAIVIDSTVGDPYSALHRSISLGREVRKLSDAMMPTGVRWSAIPIVLLVDNEAIVSSISIYGVKDRISVLPISLGWSPIYNRISKHVLDFSLELVEQMQSLGWELRYFRGRWVRVRARLPRLKGGYRRAFESELYDGTADEWLRTKSILRKRQLAMAGFDDTMTLHDVLYLQSLIFDPNVTEPALQRLVEDAPYMLRAARLELMAKPRFVAEATGDVKYPDVVHNPVLSNEIGITELKLPRAKLVARRGKLIYQAADVTEGIAQVRDYAEIAIDPSHVSQMESLFKRPVTVSSRSLIIGMSAGLDPDALDKVRSYIDDVDVRTWDSILDDAIQRYSGGRDMISGHESDDGDIIL